MEDTAMRGAPDHDHDTADASVDYSRMTLKRVQHDARTWRRRYYELLHEAVAGGAPAYGRPYVWIRFDEADDMFVCGDEDGEFARSTRAQGILPYVADLIHGPGTVRSSGLRTADR